MSAHEVAAIHALRIVVLVVVLVAALLLTVDWRLSSRRVKREALRASRVAYAERERAKQCAS